MDHFLEEVVVKHKKTLNEIAYYLSWVIIVVTGLVAVMNLWTVFYMIMGQIPFNLFAVIELLVSAGICAFTFFNHNKLRTEYEYTFTNGIMDFAQVFNNMKRKSLGSLDLKKIDAAGPVNGKAFQRYITMKDVKQSQWFLNREAELVFFYFSKDSSKRIIVCEPSEEMTGLIKQYLPFGAWQE